jgi:hypothetical protein
MKLLAVFALFIVSAAASLLNHDEALFVKETWDKIKNDESDILTNFFERYPKYLPIFFFTQDLSSVKETRKFITYAYRMCNGLSEIIKLSVDAKSLPALITILGFVKKRSRE